MSVEGFRDQRRYNLGRSPGKAKDIMYRAFRHTLLRSYGMLEGVKKGRIEEYEIRLSAGPSTAAAILGVATGLGHMTSGSSEPRAPIISCI